MNNSRGFTLIELVLVIILIGIIAGVIALPLLEGTKGWFQATTRETITESGRVAMERMMREIRNTGRKADNTPCISSAASSTFTFSDINGDLTNCNSTTFSLSGANIQRNGINLSDNVQSLTFSYYDANNAPTAVAANVRRVVIEIVSTRGGETVRKYSEVYLANMRGY